MAKDELTEAQWRRIIRKWGDFVESERLAGQIPTMKEDETILVKLKWLKNALLEPKSKKC